ncbi:neprilysin-1-like isoform X2 [Saccostrea echinata]|uniref:neprilysin-1-like isoform X2 n=1 Tax=Saccostrea echinata TaxID=191078 RepID=UPI002A840213|nr:neprilysin-1-like isoform X2 [Saccostrea echinata]
MDKRSTEYTSIKDPKKGSGSQRLYCLLVLALAAIIAVSVALAVVVIQREKDDDTPSVKSKTGANKQNPDTTNPDIITIRREVCNSPECVRAASSLLDAIDTSVDPCDDFFQYACGLYRKKQVIPEDKSITGVFYQVDDSVDIILKYLLEKDNGENDIEAVQKAKTLYRSCVDLEALEKDNLTSARRLIEDLGGWPVTDENWNESTFNLTNLLTTMRLYTNSPPLMDMYVYDDSKNPTKNILYVDQPALGLPDRDYFLKGRNDRKLKAYEIYATKMAVIFGADPATAADDMAEMVDFEIDVANATMPSDERRDDEKLYHKMMISELQTKYPNFEWLQYFKATLGRKDLNITVQSSTPVINRNPDYMTKIVNTLVSKDKRMLQNYVVWRALILMIGAMPKSVREIYGDYRETLTGSAVQPPRWKTCVGVANSIVGLAVGKPFLEETFDSKAKSKADEMIENLRSAMKDLLKQNEWMDAETKTKAREKADQIQPRIGYPPEVKNDTFLNERYKDYKFNLDNYFTNALNYLKLGTKENLEILPKPVDRKKWETPPATVNAYYNPARNQIMFPAGILQPPFYKSGYPQYLNYGGIGYVIGHEITHGFDDSGRQYDGAGNLKQWWTNTSINNFKSRADCMTDQYSGYTVEEAHKNLNGKLTLGENIADNGGLKESWLAYQKWLKKARDGKPEPYLPGLEYTPKQLFFLNAAHVWCGLVRPEEALRRILVDPHGNFKSRVVGPLQNNVEFSEAFNCKAGSFMNPRKKCIVW